MADRFDKYVEEGRALIDAHPDRGSIGDGEEQDIWTCASDQIASILHGVFGRRPSSGDEYSEYESLEFAAGELFEQALRCWKGDYEEMVDPPVPLDGDGKPTTFPRSGAEARAQGRVEEYANWVRDELLAHGQTDEKAAAAYAKVMERFGVAKRLCSDCDEVVEPLVSDVDGSVEFVCPTHGSTEGRVVLNAEAQDALAEEAR